MTFNTIEDALEAYKKGEFLVVMDDEDRENEGDLIIAAEKVTQEKMAFLVRHSSGFVCVPLSAERADALDLQPMVPHNTDRHGTAYTITVDYGEGTTTGISAHDRALTVRQLANPDSKPADFLRPGHICPLRARPGLLRERVGHTEAAVQLCVLSGMQPAGAICELVNADDGLMMRLPECTKFAQEHGLKIICIKHLLDSIDERAASLDVKISKLNTELATYQQKMAKMRDGPGKAAIKQRALKVLKQRKQLEAQKDQLDAQSWNISQAQMTTENLKNTMITVDALKSSNKELKRTYGKIDIDKIEALQDEMLDLIDQSNELQDSLARSYDVPDDISESELDAELEALGDEVAEDETPAYLEMPTFVDEPIQPEQEETVKEGELVQ
ncbi:hypothetical protein KL905_003401 [Ogataea polymorpha]|nr:hypothetical protein KL937_003617 [Ogataea polymorpha]KAG7888069.1 hypothetical protein KL936_004087 [Ogataea polymorpha]KAG7892265.1 hypothetical protein KL908_003870 [Ogataea polymorpha]KAG7899523.1 hypothetical protein KL935_003833 [Ogataea polymorpha]KAG7904738.1 hypothetical protein KL907_003614 [Ogataea polymorpha]